jgi:hypothetical protein
MGMAKQTLIALNIWLLLAVVAVAVVMALVVAVQAVIKQEAQQYLAEQDIL